MAKGRRWALSVVLGLVLMTTAVSGMVPVSASGGLVCEVTDICLRDILRDPDANPAPTAGQMVFTRTVEGQTDLAVLDTSSGEVRALDALNSPAIDRDPAVSPDGKLIAFASNREGDYDLYVAELDQPATTLRRLTSAHGDENDPAWSPEAGTQRLAYTYVPQRGRDPRHVRIMDLAAGTDAPIDISRYSFGPAWSPTGDRIALAGGGTSTGINILVYTFGSADAPVQLTTGGRDEWEKSPNWSPDGRWIVFSSYRQSTKGRLVTSDWALAASRPTDSDGDGVGDDLHLVHSAGGSYVDQADWHPDGTALAFSTGKIIRVTVAEGGNRLQAGTAEDMTAGPSDEQPEWRPDPTVG